MATPKIFESEYRFCLILWEREPVSSAELAKICKEKLGWSRTTTYTVIHRLSDRGAAALRGHLRPAAAAARAHGGAAGGEGVPVGVRLLAVHPRRDPAAHLSAFRAGGRGAGDGACA